MSRQATRNERRTARAWRTAGRYRTGAMAGDAMRSGGGASWRDTSPWLYRRVSDDGEVGPARYADTLADIRTDFIDDEDAFRYEIKKRVRGDTWATYGDLIFGPSGPVLRRAR